MAIVTFVLALMDAELIGVWGIGCPHGLVTPTCNPSRTIDYAVFGAHHLYAMGIFGYDPEGLSSIFGALVAASFGVTIGHIMLGRRGNVSTANTAETAVSVVLGGLALSALLDRFVPAFKKQWTAPFTLLISSVTATVLLLVHLCIDRQRSFRLQRWLQWPLVALGRNSLFVDFGSHCLTNILITHPSGDATINTLWFVRLQRHIAVFGHPQICITVFLEVFWISLACLLHKGKIYLRP